MANATCSIEECDRPAAKRGWCNTHYIRWRRHGDHHHVERIRGDDEARFWSKIDVGHPLGCWVWTGAPNGRSGYGRLKMGEASRVMAHRYAYEQLVGPIPDGLQLDHLCRNTLCVNPDHLEPVELRENVLRGYGPTARNASKTRCVRGHRLGASAGQRRCRSCRSERES